MGIVRKARVRDDVTPETAAFLKVITGVGLESLRDVTLEVEFHGKPYALNIDSSGHTSVDNCHVPMTLEAE